MRARASFCTRSTAASAVRPDMTASCSRRTQPRSFATIRTVSSTSRCSPAPMRSPCATSSSMVTRIASIACSSLESSPEISSAISCLTMTRGSCSKTWPRPTPSTTGAPFSDTGRYSARSRGSCIACNSPEAISSASSIAVVCNASISSSE